MVGKEKLNKDTTMNFKNINRYLLTLLGLCMLSTIMSCSDWTDVDNKEYHISDIQNQNPKLYAKYLESLKAYKNEDHKVIYAWFDNSEKKPHHRSQHITNVPDSVDVIILEYPKNLADWELTEMDEVRTNKGTKVIYSIKLESIKADYLEVTENLAEEKAQLIANATAEANKKLEDAIAAGQTDATLDDFLDLDAINSEFPDIDFKEFLTESLQELIKLDLEFNYDGINIGYLGKGTTHLFPNEKKEYEETEAIFIGLIKGWIERNSNKWIVFEGKPQNLIDKSFLESCKHIMIPTAHAVNPSALLYEINTAIVDGVPTDRFVVTAQIPSNDPNNATLGFWTDNTPAVTSTATWATGSFAFDVSGLGILNINQDYFSTPSIYTLSRSAIGILNPSLK